MSHLLWVDFKLSSSLFFSKPLAFVFETQDIENDSFCDVESPNSFGVFLLKIEKSFEDKKITFAWMTFKVDAVPCVGERDLSFKKNKNECIFSQIFTHDVKCVLIINEPHGFEQFFSMIQKYFSIGS